MRIGVSFGFVFGLVDFGSNPPSPYSLYAETHLSRLLLLCGHTFVTSINLTCFFAIGITHLNRSSFITPSEERVETSEFTQRPSEGGTKVQYLGLQAGEPLLFLPYTNTLSCWVKTAICVWTLPVPIDFFSKSDMILNQK